MSWNDALLQTVPLPECPFCGITDRPILVRSSRAADGATWQRCVCRGCSKRWQRVLLPNSGKLDACSVAKPTGGDDSTHDHIFQKGKNDA